MTSGFFNGRVRTGGFYTKSGSRRDTRKLRRRKPHKEKPKQRNPNKMKAITVRMQKFSRPGVILMAAVVAIITSMVVANATQSITTPNAAFISYSLAAGASSAAITPATNKWVLVGGCTTVGDPGVG